MNDFLLSSFSLMALIIMLTALLFVLSLKRSRESADYKKWLIIYFIGLLLWHAMGFLSGGLHSAAREQTYRYTNTLFNIGIAISGLAYIQTAYLFPQKAFEKERLRVGRLTAVFCVLYIGSILWYHFIQNQAGLSSSTYGRFVNFLAGLFGLITTTWAAFVYLRKGLHFRRSQPAIAVPARLLAGCTFLLLFISGLFIYPGANHPWVMLVYTYGLWILTQAEVLIFIIYSAFPIRLQLKIVGFLFAGVMAILSVATMVLLPFTNNAQTPANLAQRLADQPTLVRLFFLIAGSAAFVLLVFPLVLKESIIKPLERLLGGIRRADKGDLTVNIPHGMMDEIGILTRSFNGMIGSLKQSKDALTHYADTLESQVATRTVELRNSLKELQSTQAQLIQREKMASLGELTAGIAHEIQNPLNFVNNFAAINQELLSEMKEEIDKGNFTGVRALIGDLEANEEKINHHGRRADSIVKGMLQHASTGKGEKKLTNINQLAEEYLRLSYQGQRAKDKAFNPCIKTKFDDAVDVVSVVPQDIGRVLLNVFNNAFYAVSEKMKKANGGYEPLVSVRTGREGNNVVIAVKDNGTGIPQKVVDKIFQPFFTTKPTGEGTGLGLSLSYDIITKGHGGNFLVQSREDEGAEFVIELPARVL